SILTLVKHAITENQYLPNHYDASKFSYVKAITHDMNVISNSIDGAARSFVRNRSSEPGRIVKRKIYSALRSAGFEFAQGHELDYYDKVLMPCFNMQNIETYTNLRGLDFAATTNENAGRIAFLCEGASIDSSTHKLMVN